MEHKGASRFIFRELELTVLRNYRISSPQCPLIPQPHHGATAFTSLDLRPSPPEFTAVAV